MEYPTYTQLPLISREKICPVCQCKVDNEKFVTIAYDTLKNNKTKVKLADVKIAVPFCERCKLPFLNTNIINNFKKYHKGLCLRVYKLKKKDELKKVRFRIHDVDVFREKIEKTEEQKKNKEATGRKIVYYKGFRISTIYDENPEYRYKDIRVLKSYEAVNVCHCGKQLYENVAYIPLNKHKRVEILGKCCDYCDIIYVPQKYVNHIEFFLKDNIYAKDFSFNGNTYYNYSEIYNQTYLNARQEIEDEEKEKQQRDILNKINSPVMMLEIEFEEGETTTYIIVEDENSEDIQNHILYYTNDVARELLAAALVKEKNGIANIDNHKFKILESIYPNKRTHISEELMPDEDLYIRRDGGCSSSIKNNFCKIVNALLYAPSTKRYEIIEATYEKGKNIIYTDDYFYRKFVDAYGFPQINVQPYLKNMQYRFGWDQLKAESFLMECGYSVSQTNELSVWDRRKILRRVVDYKLLTVSAIISHLNFCISHHPTDKDFIAREKWKADRDYIAKYKQNPETFVIVNSIKK